VTLIDWIAVLIVAITALGGLSVGLVWSGLSLAGLIGGALIGGHYVAPHLLAREEGSPYAALIALGAALVCAFLLEAVGSAAGAAIRDRMRASPLRWLDTAGGLIGGALTGLVALWVLGAVGLNLPGHAELRRDLQRSAVLEELNSIAPPTTVLNLLARIDPLPTIVGPRLPSQPPDPRVLGRPGVRAAAPSVVRVRGTACGLGVEGSGWVAGPETIVTAAHVVAGQTDTTVISPSGASLGAETFAFDPHNDVAVLHVRGLPARALRLVDPRPGAPVAILGYPENGPFDAEPGRIGTTVGVFTQDAYGRVTARTVTSFSGKVRPGNSGGPAVDARGAVATTVFAARTAGGGGLGVPASIVRRALAGARQAVSTGPCAR
jgi:Trypsin-like peptidase domain/Colicin V production protein